MRRKYSTAGLLHFERIATRGRFGLKAQICRLQVKPHRMPTPSDSSWPFLNRVLFRFFFVYFCLFFNPLTFFTIIPGLSWLGAWFNYPMEVLVNLFNEKLFRIKSQLVPMGGSGDTSYGWALFYTHFLLAVGGAALWSILDRRRSAYPKLYYFLGVGLRYTVAGIAFTYGILKVFAMQMYFPNLSQLATPLGDFLPMRFSWLFIGYSTPYQVFSGIAEVLVALLLIWRNSALLGSLLSVGVFTNVFMLNMSYDIPVKIYSFHLLLASIYLVWQERERLIGFFLKNAPTLPSAVYTPISRSTWFNVSRWVLKVFFLITSFGMVTYDYYQYRLQYHADLTKELPPVDPGMYHVELFVKNGDTIPESLADTLRWRDVIFDYNGAGSFSANDSTFRMRYGRAYFDYRPDRLGTVLEWRKASWDSLPLVVFDMEIPEKGRMLLNGVNQSDTLSLVLKKLPRHFPLTERQFHWLSESNR